MFFAEADDGIPDMYPLGLNGCGDGLPDEYCSGYQFQPGGMGAGYEGPDYKRAAMICGIGAIAMKILGFSWKEAFIASAVGTMAVEIIGPIKKG